MLEIIKNHIFHLDEILLMLHYNFTKQSHEKWWLTDIRFDADVRDDITFCYDVLKDVSRSFAEVICQLPNNISLDFVILYLRARALDTIEDETPILNDDLKKKKKILKHFHKETNDILYEINDVKHRRLIHNYSRVMKVSSVLSNKSRTLTNKIIKKMAKGMIKYLDSKIETVEQYNDYCYYVAGLVGEILTQFSVVNGFEDANFIKQTIKNKNVFSNHRKGGLDKSMGIFLQKTNIIRDYKEDIDLNKQWWPKDIWGKYSDDFSRLPESPNANHCINELINDNLENIPDILEYLKLVQNVDYFKFCATPQIIAIHTQALCYNNVKLYQQKLKIRKGLAIKAMKANSYKHVCHQFRNALNIIKSKIDNKTEIGLVTEKNIMIIETIISKEIGPEKTIFEKINQYLFLLIVLVVVNFLFYKFSTYFDPNKTDINPPNITNTNPLENPINNTEILSGNNEDFDIKELAKTAGKLFGLNNEDIEKAMASRTNGIMESNNNNTMSSMFNINSAELPSTMGMPMIFTLFGTKI
jgi:farnesyl-diphosphate farnesyltransferase